MKNLIYSLFFLLFLIISIKAEENTDSLSFITFLEKIQAKEHASKEYASALQTASVLAEAGLYADAIDLLNKVVLGAGKIRPVQSLPDTALESDRKKRVQTKVAGMFRLNNITDANEKEYTATQRDSVSLLKRYMGGIVTKWTIHPEKWGIERLQPEFYITSIVLSPVLRLKAGFLEDRLTISNRLSLEKVLGTFYPATKTLNVADDHITTASEKYQWVGLQSDSSDLFMNTFHGEWSNKQTQKRFIYSLPVRWTYMYFRTNKPILSSRSAYAVIPFIEYRFDRADMTLAGSWFLEYSDYFNDGRDLPNDTVGLVNADVNDKLYNNPTFTFSWFVNRLHLELSQSLLWEYYPNREYLFRGAVDNINDTIITGSYFDTDLNDTFPLYWTEPMQQTLNSRWWESQIRFSYRPLQWLNTKLDLSFLSAKDRVVFINYNTLQDIMNEHTFCKKGIFQTAGTGVKINPVLEYRLPQDILLTSEYLFEFRNAPIRGPYNFKLDFTKKSTGKILTQNWRFQWAKYTAHAPTISCAVKKKRVYAKLSETFRFEKVKPDSAYILADTLTNSSNIICSSYLWRTRWNVLAHIMSHLSISCNGIFEIRNYDLTSTLYKVKGFKEKRKRNVSLAAEVIISF